jgi:hypothetical protein
MRTHGGGGNDETLRLHVSSPERPQYWIYIEVRSDARLEDVDDYLRALWLTCCGHLSSFTIGGKLYDVDGAGASSMNISVARALNGVGAPFQYEYDFGSTTRLRLRVSGREMGRKQLEPVRLLARNDAPVYQCRKCKADAVLICNGCSWDKMRVACDRHASLHRPCDEDYWLPLLNSPRAGVCAYGGSWPDE